MLVNTDVAWHGSPSGWGNDTAVLLRGGGGRGREGLNCLYMVVATTTDQMGDVLVRPAPSSSSSSSSGGPGDGPPPSHMTEGSSVYVPKQVAERIDQVHERQGRPSDSKWRTVARAISEFADDNGGADD